MKCPEFVKTNKFLKITCLILILIYYYVGLLSYITVPVPSIYHLFTANGSLSVAVRAILIALICLFSIYVLIREKKKPEWKWIIVFCFTLALTFFSFVISPQTYNSITIGQYQIVHWNEIKPGFSRSMLLFLSSISDFAFAFCCLFVLPLVFNSKKQILILLLPIVLIGLMECVYSFVKEKDEYIKLFNMINPEYGGYNVNIGASFGNKEDWGAFACVAFVCSLASFMFIKGKKWYHVLIKVGLVISAVIILFFTICSLCKTAIFAEIFCLIIIALFLVYILIHKKLVVGILYSVFLLIIGLGVIAFYAVPALHSSGFLLKFYNFTTNFIIEKTGSGSLWGRTSIWLTYVENIRGYNFFFGLTKAGATAYSSVVNVETQSSIHNGLAYFFACYGMVGFTIYLVLLAMVLSRIVRTWKISPSYTAVFCGAFIAALVFSLLEAEVLIVSSSTPIFVYNVLLCIFPQGLLLKEKEQQIKKESEVVKYA